MAHTDGTHPHAINADAGQPDYDAATARRNQAVLLTHGVGDRLGSRPGVRPGGSPAVSLSGQTVTVHDVPVVVYPGASASDAAYTGHFVEHQHALDPADGSQPRVDIVVMRVYDDDHDSSGRRELVTEYEPGAPGGGAPTPDPGTTEIARVDVPAGGSPGPSLTVTAPFTVAAGGVLPVRDDSERPAAGRYHGMVTYNQDTETLEVWDGSAWVPIAGPGASPPTVQDFDSVGLFQFTNGSFGIATISGTYVDCGVAFTAPTSGRVLINWNAVVDVPSETASVAYVSPVVRAGGTVGSGTVVLAAADNNSRRSSRSQVGIDEGGSRNRNGCSYLLSGLIPGNSYNVRLEHRVTGGTTAEAFHRSVIVAPAS